PPPPPLHISAPIHRECPGPGVSATLAAPRHGASPPPPSLVPLRTARVRRDGHHDPDNIPALVAHASLGLMFVVPPSRYSCPSRWLHITDFDQQNSLGRRSHERVVKF